MSLWVRGLLGSAVALSVVVCVVQPVIAGPSRAVIASARPFPVRGARSPGNIIALRSALTPSFHALTVRQSIVPIRPLPRVGTPQFATELSLLLPRLGFAALIAPLGPRSCNGMRQPVQITALPTTPFVTDDCTRRSFSDDDRELPPTTLVAGHDRNALYGPSYSLGNGDLR